MKVKYTNTYTMSVKYFIEISSSLSVHFDVDYSETESVPDRRVDLDVYTLECFHE